MWLSADCDKELALAEGSHISLAQAKCMITSTNSYSMIQLVRMASYKELQVQKTATLTEITGYKTHGMVRMASFRELQIHKTATLTKITGHKHMEWKNKISALD